MGTHYTTVTELPGMKASKEQLARLYQRYHFASKFCDGKYVLEAACGSGIGLGYLARGAKMVAAGDIDEHILSFAQELYKGRNNIQLYRFDAHKLPFKDTSFDVVILYEAIYYLARPEKFLAECFRVLRKGGILLICTANKDSPGFSKSPFSLKYFSSPELLTLLKQHHFDAEVFGDCPVVTGSIKQKLISTIRRIAVALGLIPKTMKGKEILKRIFFGKLLAIPREIEDGMVKYHPPVLISCNSPSSQYRVLFAVARSRWMGFNNSSNQRR